MKRTWFTGKLRVLLITFCVGASAVFLSQYLTTPETDPHVFVVRVEPISYLPEPTPTPENTLLAAKPPQYLCDHLADLKHMAWYPRDHSGDAVYDALKRNGYYSMPCLIDKITDMRPAENPTGAPFWAGLTYR